MIYTGLLFAMYVACCCLLFVLQLLRVLLLLVFSREKKIYVLHVCQAYIYICEPWKIETLE